MYGTSYLRNDAGQYVVTANGAFIADNTLRKLGNYNPDFQVGFTNRLAYRNFNLGAPARLAARRGDRESYAGAGGLLRPAQATEIVRPRESSSRASSTSARPRRPTTSRTPRPSRAEDYYITFYNREHEENNTLDATFVKLREVRLGYDFSTRQLPWLQDASVALIGRNLAMWSPIKLFDPEQFAAQGQGFVRGVEDMCYPTPRSIGLSLSANF